ncbi:MAG: hypothetical protein ACI8Z5_000307 [Lentimonas sp.]|jgi:hypothetical protein
MKIVLRILLLLPLFALVGCVSPVRVDYDREAAQKFSSYQCFEVDSRELRSNYQDIVLSPIVDRRIERELNAVLEMRGFSNDCSKPDFRVTFNTAKKTVTELNDLGVGPTPYRRYPYSGLGNYSNVQTDQYEEGTFIVDIIDLQSKELVWRGAYVKRLGWNAPTDAEIREIIIETLAQFPPAG